MSIKVVLCDIEGTTTSISFVHDVLFPYSLSHLESYLFPRWDQSPVSDELYIVKDALAVERGVSANQLSKTDVIEGLKSWIKSDRKHGALKKLQGMIWRNGYHSDRYRAHLYSDVPKAFQTWKSLGVMVAIYSSGSIEAQQLLFSHSVYSDLTPLISNYFDTSIGPKRESASYNRITSELNIGPNELLFLSDTPEELDAAVTSGFNAIQLLRTPVSSDVYPTLEGASSKVPTDTIRQTRHPYVFDFTAINLKQTPLYGAHAPHHDK